MVVNRRELLKGMMGLAGMACVPLVWLLPRYATGGVVYGDMHLAGELGGIVPEQASRFIRKLCAQPCMLTYDVRYELSTPGGIWRRRKAWKPGDAEVTFETRGGELSTMNVRRKA